MNTKKINMSKAQANAQMFFVKVMSYFGLAMIGSTVGVYIGIQIPGILKLSFVIIIAELALIFTSQTWSKKQPLAYWMFGLFTLLSGITLVPLLAHANMLFGISIILQALLSTALTFFAMAAIGLTTHKDLSGMGQFLFFALIGIIVLSIVQIFFQSSIGELFISGAGVLIFSGFVAYDFQRIKTLGASGAGESEAVMAAIGMYLNMFNLFTFILRLMMGIRSND